MTSEQLQQEKRILNEIQISLSTFDASIGTGNEYGKVAYASSPITTGKRMYDIFRKFGVRSVSELKAIDQTHFTNRIMNPNIQEGNSFGQELRQEYKAAIAPSTFFAKGWAQEHYMSLWRQVIERHADIVVFNYDWEYSNGCAQEFLIGLGKNIPLKERGSKTALTKNDGLQKIEKAITAVDDLGADTKPLFDTYREILLFRKSPTVLDLATQKQP